jgi:hypothetical protein
LTLQALTPISQTDAIQITQYLEEELFYSGKFDLVERTQVDKILRESQYQQSGVCDIECAVLIGKQLAAKKVIIGTVGKLGSAYTIQIKLIDVETGKIERPTSIQPECRLEDLPGFLRSLIVKLTAPFEQLPVELKERVKKETKSVEKKEEKVEPPAKTPPEKMKEAEKKEPVKEIITLEKGKEPQAKDKEAELSKRARFGVEVALFSYDIEDDQFKEIYGAGSKLMYGISLSYELFKKAEILAEIDIFHRIVGALTLTSEQTTFKLTPKALSFRYKIIKSDSFSPYLGSGIVHYSYKEENPYENISGSSLGFHFEGGAYVVIKKIFIDLNFRYTNVKSQENDIEASLGGIRVGIGLGFLF